jgi:hypothetical protein
MPFNLKSAFSHSRMFLAGIHFSKRCGCPTGLSPNVFIGEAFGHDSVLHQKRMETHLPKTDDCE